jgi:cation-transporting ATPase 13A1
MRASGFSFDLSGRSAGGHLSLSNVARGLRVTVRHKLPFSSTLKRMSAVVEVERIPSLGASSLDVVRLGVAAAAKSVKSIFVFTKGAPEVLEQFLVVVPPHYKATYRHHMSKGRRVLTMACKKLPLSTDVQAFRGSSRADIECQLEFVGFLVFDCDLKADSKSVLRELRASNHRVIMITGDSAFTAAEVARKLGMLVTSTAKSIVSTLVLKARESSQDATNGLVWCRLADAEVGEKNSSDIKFLNIPSALSKLSGEFSLCVTGPELVAMEQALSISEYSAFLQSLCPHVSIFARVSPAQKEAIVLALNDSGLFTLMCGDGTNDVGALKAAHVGISIVNNPEFERRVESAGDQDGAVEHTGKKPKGASAKDRMTRSLKELQEQEADPTIVKLGDASIASPFTARRTSIDSVLTVIRQGRCTLVTTIQVFIVISKCCCC